MMGHYMAMTTRSKMTTNPYMLVVINNEVEPDIINAVKVSKLKDSIFGEKPAKKIYLIAERRLRNKREIKERFHQF